MRPGVPFIIEIEMRRLRCGCEESVNGKYARNIKCKRHKAQAMAGIEQRNRERGIA